MFGPDPVPRQFTLEIALATVGIRAAITHLVDLERATAEDRVVPSAGIGDHRHHRARQVRAQDRALADKDVLRHLDRVRRMIALGRVLGIVAKEIDRLGAF